MKACTVLA